MSIRFPQVLAACIAVVVQAHEGAASQAALFPELDAYIAESVAQFDQIPEARKQALKKLALFVRTRVRAGESPQLTFICTHNSRRSHMSQLWAQVAAAYYGVPNVRTYSGGTEATAFNPRAVAALQRAGFRIDQPSATDNPVYEVRYGTAQPALPAFSKVYNHAPNPAQGFAAVMTCSQADKNCPVVDGATLRVAIPYDDPKAADGTAQESATYDDRCRQISREMLYLFSQAS